MKKSLTSRPTTATTIIVAYLNISIDIPTISLTNHHLRHLYHRSVCFLFSLPLVLIRVLLHPEHVHHSRQFVLAHPHPPNHHHEETHTDNCQSNRHGNHYLLAGEQIRAVVHIAVDIDA
jgi:hypothetical protein